MYSKFCFTCIFVAVLVPTYGCATDMQNTPVTGVQSFRIDASDLPAVIRSAEAGDRNAAYRLAQHYDFFVQDEERALRWIRNAAMAGHVSAQYGLGVRLSQSGKKDEKVLQEAKSWLEKAMAAGHPLAASVLEDLKR